jgi:hypothetical protein
MAGNTPGKPDWRQAGTKQDWRSRGAAAPSNTPRWAQPKPDKRPPGSKLWIWVGGSLAVVLALVGWFVAKTFRPHYKTPFVVVTVTDYDFPVAPNAWAREDADAFGAFKGSLNLNVVDLFPQGTDKWWDQEGKDPKKRFLDHLTTELKKVEQDRHFLERWWSAPTIIYLSVHGMVNGAGQPCFLLPNPPDMPPGDRNLLLPVSEVLGLISDTLSGKKLLILDANRMRNNWSLGLLENTFASRLKTAVDDHGDSELVVLNSAHPGQVGGRQPAWAGRSSHTVCSGACKERLTPIGTTTSRCKSCVPLWRETSPSGPGTTAMRFNNHSCSAAIRISNWHGRKGDQSRGRPRLLPAAAAH